MARLRSIHFYMLVAILLVVELASAQNQPRSSPTPSLDLDSYYEDSPAPETGFPPSPFSPSPAQSLSWPTSVGSPEEQSSPQAPIMDVPAPTPSSNSSPEGSLSPAPSPEASDVSHADTTGKKPSSGGMSGGKKAGIVVGVLAAACVVGLGGLVYKKRLENIQRSRYGYAARDFM